MRLKYSKEFLGAVVKKSSTWRQVCEELNIKPFSGNEAHLRKRAQVYQIDFSHFPGQGWNRGKSCGYKRPIEDYLVVVSHTRITTDALRKRLIAEGLKQAECEICKCKTWMGHPIRLELDHKNGNHFDNRLENLQILCPNCHSQKTFEKGRMGERQTRMAQTHVSEMT